MLGARVGLRVGGRHGVGVGVGQDQLAHDSGIPGVSRDAASSNYFPASSAEWTTFLAAVGLTGIVAVPSALHGFQNASGNITDQISTITMTTVGTPSYQQAEAGYTRKAVVTTDGAGQSFSSSAAALPDPASASCLSLAVMRVTTPGTIRTILRFGSATQTQLQVNTNGRLRASTNAGGNLADGAAVVGGSVLPFSLRYNVTATTLTAFSNAEKLAPTWAAASGKLLQVTNSTPAATLYAAHWFGANAEVSDANYKALLQAMGFTITWS